MKIIKFDTIPSTNLYLKENYQVLDNLTVVCAKHQTKGRGRLGRTWIDNNDLLFSILLKDNLNNPSDYSFLIASSIKSSGRIGRSFITVGIWDTVFLKSV